MSRTFLGAFAVATMLMIAGSAFADSTATKPGSAKAKQPEIFKKVLRQQGQEEVHTYRIPGLTTTKAGSLIAVFDLRYTSARDLPGDVDVGMMRSTDLGSTWEPMQVILDYPADEPDAHGNGVGDPCVLADLKTGTIFVAGLWSKGLRGWAGSGPGMSPDETGQFVLTRSDDDGRTWSEPINITSQVKRPEWKLCFQRPGRGIQLRDGTLVMPAQYKDELDVPHSFFIYSEDHGEHWQASPPVVVGTNLWTTEAQVAELANGDILISMRNHDVRKQRAWATFSRNPRSGKLTDGKWSPVSFALNDPQCMGALVSYTNPEGEHIVLFANPASKTRRQLLTVYESRDGGKTWPVSKLIDSRPSAYSCLTILPDGSIGLLYETGNKHAAETLTFARFTMP
ncbi:MAG: exo-alpha-sialidase [Limisphaerales bacterium]